MRKGNFIICCVCGLVLISEWSAPGQLRFGFPFLTEPAGQLAKVPDSAVKVRNQTIDVIDKLTPAQPKDAMFQASPRRPSQTTIVQLTGKNARSRISPKSAE